MADPVVTPAPDAAAAPAAPPTPAPVASSVDAGSPPALPSDGATASAPAPTVPPTSPEPVAEAPSTPAAPAAEPGATPAQAAEPAKAEPAADPNSPPRSVLDKAGDKPAPAEAPKPDANAAPDPKAPAPTPPAVTYQPLTLPEGVTLNAERMGQFDGVLGKHSASPELRQELADMHIAEVNRIREETSQLQRQTYDRTREGWVSDWRKDPALGGARFDTVAASASSVIDRFGGTPEQVSELRSIMSLTGAGDHPAVARMLHNVDQALQQYMEEGGPVPAPAGNRAATNRADRRYGGGKNK